MRRMPVAHRMIPATAAIGLACLAVRERNGLIRSMSSAVAMKGMPSPKE